MRFFFSFIRIKYSNLLCVEYPVISAHPNACVHIVSYQNRVYDGTFFICVWRVGGLKQNLRSSTLHRFEGKSKKDENLNYFVEFHVRLVILYCTFDFYAMYAILQYFCKEKICTISYFS